MEKEWDQMTPAERRQTRLARWLSPPGIDFISPDAEKAYKKRLTRIIDAIDLKQPDRVPVILPAGTYPAYYAGKSLKTVMYDSEQMREAWQKFLDDFGGDVFSSPRGLTPGRVSEILGNKTSRWPGHGLADDAQGYQFVEGEYMFADEYDALIRDPSDFFLRTVLPRSFTALEGLQQHKPLTYSLGMAGSFIGSYALPGVRSAFAAIMEAADEMAKWQAVMGGFGRKAMCSGFPSLMGGVTMAPFDTLGDTLRGTHGIIMDMYRQPDKLQEAMEVIAPINTAAAVAGADASGGPIIFMPLHKGDDTFMSDGQFETFYWPSLKKVILGLVDQGCIPLLFAEGKYNDRLKTVKDLPRGAVLWQFDQTDMARAKKELGDVACISGNVPTSLMCTGTPEAVKDCCRKLIRECGPGGGYILAGGAAIEKGDPANMHAMREAAEEYGVYR